jgi:hypothetical protein
LKLLTPPLPVTVAGGGHGSQVHGSGVIGGTEEDVDIRDKFQMVD